MNEFALDLSLIFSVLSGAVQMLVVGSLVGFGAAVCTILITMPLVAAYVYFDQCRLEA